MEKENAKEIKMLSKMLGADRLLSPEDVEKILEGIFTMLTNFKKSNLQLNEDTKKEVEDILKVIGIKQKELYEDIKDGKKELIALHKEQCDEIAYLVEEFKKIKPKDGKAGKNADEEKIISKIYAMIDKSKTQTEQSVHVVNVTGEEIVDKINALDYTNDNLIDLKRIKGWETLFNGKKSTKGFQPTVIGNAMDLDTSARANGYAIVWDAATGNHKYVSNSGGGGGTMEIGGDITSATQGSILFAGASGVLAQDNANFFFDDTNNRLGIGTNAPSRTLHVVGNTSGGHALIERTTSATTGLAGTMRLMAVSTGDMADTFGAQLTFSIKDDAGVENDAVVLASLRNGADNTSSFQIYLANAGSNTARFKIDNNGVVSPSTSDASSLGSGSLMWSDLFLASGSVINFNNGDVTLTHASNLLTLAGGDFSIGTTAVFTAGTIELGAASDTTISRVSAGQIAIEGVTVATSSNTLTFTTKTIDASANTITNLSTAMFAANVIDVDTSLAANSDTRLATQKAVKAYVDASVTGLLDLKGSTDCSANPNYPSALKGDSYYVTVAGKIGGASGKTVEIGDVYVALADNAGGTEASVGISWFVLNQNLSGVALTSGTLAQFAATTSAQLAGVISDETGTGALVFANTPTLVSPILGTPTSGTLTNCTGLPVGSLVSDTSTALGLGSINLGHATDTTIARVSAGVVSIEGVNIVTVSSTDSLSNKTLTAPKFANTGFIADANGNEQIIFTTTASAVNEFTFINAATGNAPQIAASGGDTNVDIKLVPKGTGIVKGELKRFQVRLADSTTALTTGTSKGGDYRISNRAITVKAVGAYVDTAATGGTLLTIDINEAGTTIISTKITLDASEKTSETAATPPVISDASIAADAIVTFDIDAIGNTTPGTGLVVWVDYVYA